MGWIIVYDKNHVFDEEVRKGLLCMSQRIIGSNTLIQGALPTILANTPASFFENTISIVQRNAQIAYSKLKTVPGMMPVMPQVNKSSLPLHLHTSVPKAVYKPATVE